MSWVIGTGVLEQGFAHLGSLRGNGTKWHWLAAFEKVSIPDLQAQKRFSLSSRNVLVHSPSARARGWHKMALFPRILIADLQVQKGFRTSRQTSRYSAVGTDSPSDEYDSFGMRISHCNRYGRLLNRGVTHSLFRGRGGDLAVREAL
jgi:hypothetical protein